MNRCAVALGAFVLTAGFAVAVPTPMASASPCESGQIPFIEKTTGRVTCMTCPAGTTALPSGWCQRNGTGRAPSAPSTSESRGGGSATT